MLGNDISPQSGTLVVPDTKNIVAALDPRDRSFLEHKASSYVKSLKNIEELIDLGVLVTGIPIKLQTMAEKRKIIRNFDQCVETYNRWVENNPGIADKVSDSDCHAQDLTERLIYRNPLSETSDKSSSNDLPAISMS